LTNVVGLWAVLLLWMNGPCVLLFLGGQSVDVGGLILSEIWRSSRQVWSCLGFSRLVDLVCRVVVEIVCVPFRAFQVLQNKWRNRFDPQMAGWQKRKARTVLSSTVISLPAYMWSQK
jgi:hypothetical protein